MFLEWHDYRMPLKEVPFRPFRFWIIIGLHAWILKCSFDEIIVSSILARKDRLWSKTWKFWKVLLFKDIIIYFFYIKESVVVMDRNHLIGGPEMMDRWNHFYEFLVKPCISVHLKVESVIAWDCHEIKECSMQCLTYLCSKLCRQNRSKKGHYL